MANRHTKKTPFMAFDFSIIAPSIERQLNVAGYYSINALKYEDYKMAIHLLRNAELITERDAQNAWSRLNKRINRYKKEFSS